MTVEDLDSLWIDEENEKKKKLGFTVISVSQLQIVSISSVLLKSSHLVGDDDCKIDELILDLGEDVDWELLKTMEWK